MSYAKALAGYSQEVSPAFDEDIIHKLRVAFKKLRALLRWQRIDKRQYKAFKKLYRIAGEIRNIQLLIKMLKKQKNVPVAFKKWLFAELNTAEREWSVQYSGKTLRDLKKNLSKLTFRHKKNKSFFPEQLGQIKTILTITPVEDTSLHDIRKLAKDMQYILEYKKENQEDLSKEISIEELKTVTSQIGDYNDSTTSLLLLTKYRQEQKLQTLIQKTTTIMATWKRQKTAKKKRLLLKLRSMRWKAGDDEPK